MLDQLSQLVQQFWNDAIVKNNAIPNEQNEAVMNEACSSIFSGLQKIASEGGVEQLAALFQSNNAQDATNPAFQKLTEQLKGSLITQVLGSLVSIAKDPNEKSFQITDIIVAITSGEAQSSGVMEAISKYGTQFGLDQNADGKLDIQDVLVITKSSWGISGFIGKLFRKK